MRVPHEQIDDDHRTPVTVPVADDAPHEADAEHQSVVDDVRPDLANHIDLRDAIGLLVAPHNDGECDAAGSATDIDRVTTPTGEAHPDAIADLVAINPRVEGVTSDAVIEPVEGLSPQLAAATRSHQLVAGGPRLPRDRFALLEIARYRLMSFRQLQTQVFGRLHKSVLTRRMQALKRARFISTWEEQLVLGGHPLYAVPTKAGLSWALAELRAETAGTPHEKLVQLMIGEAAKRPLVLLPRTAPPFLPHQEETNRVVAALEAVPELGITWASTWHRPFPNEIADLAMPQPDAVLVATRNGRPHLVFLEHDRGQEAPASFAQKKAARYSDLALYSMTHEIFGFDEFTVWVTVNDVANCKPLQRIRALQAVSRNALMMRFTLAGWIPAHAHRQPIWFTPSTAVTAREHRPDAHTDLVEPFASRDDNVPDDATADLIRRLRAPTAALPDDIHAT